jgi:hypothetical protein
MMLDVKDAVQDYMKSEMEASARTAQQQLEEQTSKLAIEESWRLELETTYADLHATLDAKRERRSAMNALRDAEDELRYVECLLRYSRKRYKDDRPPIIMTR